MALSDEKYLLLTTFKRDGTPIDTPVWVVPYADGKLACWTSSGSGKAKRLAHTSRVTVAPCDARGRLRDGATASDATAELVTGAQLEQEIRPAVEAKYGFQVTMSKVMNTIGGTLKGKRIPYGDRGVVITVSEPV